MVDRNAFAVFPLSLRYFIITGVEGKLPAWLRHGTLRRDI